MSLKLWVLLKLSFLQHVMSIRQAYFLWSVGDEENHPATLSAEFRIPHLPNTTSLSSTKP